MTLQEFIQQDYSAKMASLDKYQIDIVNELVSNSDGDYLKAADEWLTANMPETVAFGGDGRKSIVFRENLFMELEKLICGCDEGQYDGTRAELKSIAESGKASILSLLSAAIGAHFGVSAAFLAPAIVLLIQGLGSITIQAWCETQKAKREKQ